MKKRSVVIVVALVAIAFLMLLAHHHANSLKLKTFRVRQGNIVEQVQAAGYITPQHSISVKSEVGGNVEKVFHDAGDYVTKGQPLVAIKPMPSPADYAAAKENVLTQRSAMQAAKRDFWRYRLMLKKGLITTNYGDYIAAQQVYQQAKAALALAKQQLALITTGQTVVDGKKINNTIVAPISGYVMKRNVDVGDYIDPISSKQTATILFTISDMKNLMFEGYVDEADASKIHTNMPATVEVGAVAGLALKGTLTKISLQSQQAGNASKAVDQSSIFTQSPFTSGFQVLVTKLQIPKAIQLRDGYSATANIAVKSALNVPIIPERILHFDHTKAYVLVPKAKDAKLAKKQYIKLGLSDGMNVQVIAGLKVGQMVIEQPLIPQGD